MSADEPSISDAIEHAEHHWQIPLKAEKIGREQPLIIVVRSLRDRCTRPSAGPLLTHRSAASRPP
jgi:hypothetical protein